jgi:hypothetical protein
MTASTSTTCRRSFGDNLNVIEAPMKLPKLHVRELFWLIALVAMGLG